MGHPLFLGLDIGSLTVKAVVIDTDLVVRGRGVAPAGYGGQEAAEALLTRLFEGAQLERADVARTVVTGYGRVRYAQAQGEVSEISCHAQGAHHLFPSARTVIDIGGQDSKAIRLDEAGRVLDFAMNDKCAAGTGRFLEVMASALELPIAGLGPLALHSKNAVSISSTCTVFAETEAISHIARGAAREDVAAGLHLAIAGRVLGLAARVRLEPPVVLSGGVALNVAMVSALERLSGSAITVPADPQCVGALGAALFARRSHEG